MMGAVGGTATPHILTAPSLSCVPRGSPALQESRRSGGLPGRGRGQRSGAFGVGFKVPLALLLSVLSPAPSHPRELALPLAPGEIIPGSNGRLMDSVLSIHPSS